MSRTLTLSDGDGFQDRLSPRTLPSDSNNGVAYRNRTDAFVNGFAIRLLDHSDNATSEIYISKRLAGRVGIEPTTSGTGDRRSSI